MAVAGVAVKDMSKVDIKAMREADRIVFHHDRRSDVSDGDNPGRIRCIKRNSVSAREANPFLPYESEYEIKDLYSWVSYPPDAIPDGMDSDIFKGQIRGATVEYPYAYNPGGNVLNTFISLLRPGDEVSLWWYYDAGNGYLERAGLHKDVLRVKITRYLKRQTKRFTFAIASSVCEDNSARMLSTKW